MPLKTGFLDVLGIKCSTGNDDNNNNNNNNNKKKNACVCICAFPVLLTLVGADPAAERREYVRNLGVVIFAAMVGRSSRDCIGELRKSDLHCRRALRPVVGPPFRVNWTHKVLQIWHCRIKQYTGHNGFNFWFARYVQEHSKFADPVAMKRGKQVFAWNPRMICQRFLMWDECLLDTLIGTLFGV